MRVALDLACDELGLREADAFNRARVTSAIRALAEAVDAKDQRHRAFLYCAERLAQAP